MEISIIFKGGKKGQFVKAESYIDTSNVFFLMNYSARELETERTLEFQNIYQND